MNNSPESICFICNKIVSGLESYSHGLSGNFSLSLESLGCWGNIPGKRIPMSDIKVNKPKASAIDF